MQMIKLHKYRSWWLAFVLVFVALVPLRAQEMPVVYEGKNRNLGVDAEPGALYFWKIYTDRTLSKEAPESEVNFISGAQGAMVTVTWKKQGVYYFTVSALGSTGCMNRKVGMLKVIPIEIEAIVSGGTVIGFCEQTKLDASKSIGDIVKYEWQAITPGGILTKTSGATTEFNLSSNYSGALPANFDVQLKVTDRVGRVHSSIYTVYVDLAPEAEILTTGKLEKDGSMIVDGTVSIGNITQYRWFSTEGKVLGATNEPTAKLSGAGIYTLEVTDNHGCKSLKSFKFPLEVHQISASPDYARTSWAKDTTIYVLNNDQSTVNFVPSTVHIIEAPQKGTTKINADGSITYIPTERKPGRDAFVYEVCDEVNLCASATVTIDIYDSGINAPEGFSPNGDGNNEYLVFKGLDNYPKSQLYVFTRAGQLVYQNTDYQNDWNGSIIKSSITSQELVPTGTYYYVLKLGGTNRSVKGFVYIGY